MGYFVILLIAAYGLSVLFELARVILINRRSKKSSTQTTVATTPYRRPKMDAHYYVLGQGCLVCGASATEDCDAGLHS